MQRAFKASAPGSLMLLGEYGVLHGEEALVCAIDKRITVTLTPSITSAITISSAQGEYQTTLENLEIEAPYTFVLACLKHHSAKLKLGCHLHIESDFSHQMGLGSSAAVTVATLAVIAAWLNVRLSSTDLLRQGRQVVKRVQRVGSGADIAASIYGGMVAYRAQPLSAEKIQLTYPLTVWYSGYKTKTADMIQYVQDYFATHPALFRDLMRAIGQCSTDGIHALRKQEWIKLGKIMNVQQGLMQAIGVNDALLQTMIDALQQSEGILGAKISGSGLGDCVIGLGCKEEPLHLPDADIQAIPVNITLQGVCGEKI